jgi:hypothetical protein
MVRLLRHTIAVDVARLTRLQGEELRLPEMEKVCRVCVEG